MAPGAR